MRRTNCLTLCALFLGGGLASTFLGAGCSGDSSVSNNGTPEAGPAADGSPSPEAGPTPEAGAPDASARDTGAPVDTGAPDAGNDDGGARDAGEDTGLDSGPLDAGNDSGAVDAGNDAAPNDAGSDGGQLDAGSDASAPDASDGGGGDASDGGTADTGTDAVAPIGFGNPLQVDVGSVLNANTVVTTATGGVGLTAMDGTANSGANNDFPTQAEATLLNDASGVGLPNDAFFHSNGTTIPDVQLAWSDATNRKNSLVIVGNAGTPVLFDVPPATYSQLQIYATGGSGSASLNVTLTYATGAPVTSSVPLPDWCVPGTLAANEHTLVSVDRVQNGNQFSGGILCSIYAIDLNPDSARVLTSVSLVDVGTSGNYLVFYGATAW